MKDRQQLAKRPGLLVQILSVVPSMCNIAHHKSYMPWPPIVLQVGWCSTNEESAKILTSVLAQLQARQLLCSTQPMS